MRPSLLNLNNMAALSACEDQGNHENSHLCYLAHQPRASY